LRKKRKTIEKVIGKEKNMMGVVWLVNHVEKIKSKL
jgi:hypothetical protein